MLDLFFGSGIWRSVYFDERRTLASVTVHWHGQCLLVILKVSNTERQLFTVATCYVQCRSSFFFCIVFPCLSLFLIYTVFENKPKTITA